MIELLRKYCQLNIRGLQYIGLGYETAHRIILLHLNNISALIVVIFSGVLSLFEIDRKIIGVIAILLLACLFVFYWIKDGILFSRLSNADTAKESKSIVILFTLLSHAIVIVLFCVLAYTFFGK